MALSMEKNEENEIHTSVVEYTTYFSTDVCKHIKHH